MKYVRTPPILAVEDSKGPFHAFALATNGIDGVQRGKKWWTDRIGGALAFVLAAAVRKIGLDGDVIRLLHVWDSALKER